MFKVAIDAARVRLIELGEDPDIVFQDAFRQLLSEEIKWQGDWLKEHKFQPSEVNLVLAGEAAVGRWLRELQHGQ